MKVLSGIVSVIGMAALAFALFALGYLACQAPITTEVLSQATSDYEHSPYALDDLNTLAVASRDYTVDPRPEGTTEEDARVTFDETLMESASRSAARYLNEDAGDEMTQAKVTAWTDLLKTLGQTRPADAFDKTGEDAVALAEQLADTGDQFALDEDAFEHLDDCNELINGIVPFVRYAAIAALACFLVLLVLRQWRWLARMLGIAPLALIIAFAFMGTWAVIDFNGFFSAFHGVFFPQGNWTFSSTSLLICMYPTGFWMGMGVLWLATTAVASIIVLAISRRFSSLADRKGQ